MANASALERQMLALINEERARAGLQPLQLELRLNESAEDHSEWMLDTDTFSHTGQGGSSATQRMRDAGFQFSGAWRSGENIAWQSERGPNGASDDVIQLHQSLMNSPGHRANILNPDFKYIGIGIEEGKFDGYDAVIVTQNFATTSAAVRLDTGSTPAPTPSAPSPVTVNAGTTGTAGSDWFVLNSGQAGQIDGRGGDDTLTGGNGHDTLLGGQGADILTGAKGNDSLSGADGNDVLRGGAGNDRLDAGADNDRLDGGGGDDTLLGGSGSDDLKGRDGADYLQGDGGNDTLVGGSGNDWLTGGADADRLNGGAGDDWLAGGRGADTFIFGSGSDRIMDFSDDDLIDLRKVNSITGYNDLVNNHISISGDDLIINDGNGNSITLVNTQFADLAENHFLI